MRCRGLLDLSSHGVRGETAYQYNKFNRFASVPKTDGGTTVVITHACTPKGEIASVEGYGTYKPAYTYDSAARLKKVEYSDGTPTVEYGYDRRGRVVTVTDGRGTANISYNSDSTVAFEEIPYYTNRQMKYLYDATGRMTAQGVYNSSTGEWEMQTTYTYDGRSRLASIAQGGRSAVYTRHSLSDRQNTVNFGLIPHLYRAYSPALARFLTRDPIAEQDGVGSLPTLP